ncbi:MAG: hypothetical protein S4CHLAM81_07000 [Chlamydiales bacterium]|nr:hypothetical protein [Chlamydiales bacterium]MCH9635484.1 hypothetical protein [Chlamydiales bacterium]MCH9704014.1 hypothetical protein [Chlamydiota bacterium]
MRFLLALLLFSTPLFGDELLYIIHAKTGSYDESEKRLVLNDIDHSVTYFSDTDPSRAGKTTLSNFLSNLMGEDKEFNAGFIYFTDEHEQYSDIAIVLTRPHYNFEKSELSFTVRVVTQDVPLHEHMEEVNLFVDGVPEKL